MENRKDRIAEFMKEDAYRPLLFKELLLVLDVPKTDSELFKETLDQLEEDGRIFKTNRERYCIPEKRKYHQR